MAVDTSMDSAQQGLRSIDAKTGHAVKMAVSINVDGFYDYLVGALKTLPVASS